MEVAEGKTRPKGGRSSCKWFLQILIFLATCVMVLHLLKVLHHHRRREVFVQTIETRELIFMEMVPAVEPLRPQSIVYSMNKSKELHSKELKFKDATCDLENGDIARFDCFPGPGANQENCAARGCCWRQAGYQYRRDINVPYCYFPANYPSYSVRKLQETDFGWSALLVRSTSSPWPKDIKTLAMDVIFETETRMRLKVSILLDDLCLL